MIIRTHTLFFCFVIVLLYTLTPGDTLAAWGCKQAKVKPGKSTSGCIKIDGLKRTYRLHVPAGYPEDKKSLPLVFGLHGGAGKPRRFESYSQLSKLSDKSGDFIAVYPAGIDKHWNDGRPNVNTDIDDITFLKQLVSHLESDLSLPIDRNKLFMIGMSNGGLMTMRFACEQSGWIAGAGVVAASMSSQIASYCSDKAAPTRMIFIFGDNDSSFQADGRQVNPINPSQQRGTHIGINPTVQIWADINQCHGDTTTNEVNRDPEDGTHIVITRLNNCMKPVVFHNIINGGHRWPDTTASNGGIMVNVLNLGIASRDINAAEEILKVLLSSE